MSKPIDNDILQEIDFTSTIIRPTEFAPLKSGKILA